MMKVTNYERRKFMTFEGAGKFAQMLFQYGKDAWIIRESLSDKNLANCNGEATEDEQTKTCALCVALNRTVFKANNMPQYDHKNCKCWFCQCELKNVDLIFRMEKVTRYLFVNINKMQMMKTMGYESSDADQVYQLIAEKAKSGYLSGLYELKNLNINGQHVSISFILPGVRDRLGTTYNCHIGCVVWPDGTLLIATPLIKD